MGERRRFTSEPTAPLARWLTGASRGQQQLLYDQRREIPAHGLGLAGHPADGPRRDGRWPPTAERETDLWAVRRLLAAARQDSRGARSK